MRYIMALAALTLAAPAPATAQVLNPPIAVVDTTARAAASAAQATADTAAARPIPTAASTAPPSVTDASSIGTMTTQFALANHTHASKSRKGRVLVPVSGVLDVTFGTPFVTGAPLCVVVAETTSGDTSIVNAQIDGVTSLTGFRLRITRTTQSVAAVLGLTVLSVPTQIATQAHYICVEP